MTTSKSQDVQEGASEKQTLARQVLIRFRLNAPLARQILLVGDFTSWEGEARQLQRDSHGVWRVDVLLQPGRYRYAYIINDRWITDPLRSEFESDARGNYVSVMEVA